MYSVKTPTLFKAFRWLAAAAFVVAMATPAVVDGVTITRIEEDWELVIVTPSPNADAPQVTCVISPLADINGLHSTFVVNHHEAPSFAAGGLQLQAWNGEDALDSMRSPNQAILATPNETIRWTQVMRLREGNIAFKVINGTSTTWGSFGNNRELRIALASSLADLNGYDPEVSVKNSGVSFGANRVSSLVLKRVRTFTSTGEVTEDANPRVVHSLNQ
jgi:hypothetical protein